ncbi:MAG: carbon-nitrogen hydrolase family protein [Thermomicrobiales bacterium]
MPPQSFRIGLASMRNYPTVEERLLALERMMRLASEREVAVVCFPETYIPGLRGLDFEVPPPDQQRQEGALVRIAAAAKEHAVAAIVGMEWETDGRTFNLAIVVAADGSVLGTQTKNQIPPSEEPYYVAGTERALFEIDGVPVGVTICHEGWRYPESVRWAAENGAKVVFHPQLTGSDLLGPTISRWGDPDAPYYEKAMVMRALENTVWFASVNYALQYQESATTVVDPEGQVAAFVPYGQEQLLVYDLDLAAATGFYALRMNRDQYQTPAT